MTASPKRRRRSTIVGFVVTVVLAAAAGVLVTVGALTLSNSQEGEAVGVDPRPVSVLPATPNALLAVEGDDGALLSVVVATLLPEGVGGSVVVIPRNADATAAFGEERQPLVDVFDGDDIGDFATTVEEMLSITIEREAVVAVDEFDALIGSAPPNDDLSFDEEFWAEAIEAASTTEVTTPPVDTSGTPAPPADTAELFSRLLAGDVQTRALATRDPSAPENPTDADVVIIDRRDANLVFAQVSPALVSTPNVGLSVRILAPFTPEQIEASNGRYESTSEVMLDVIGQMLFFQTNVVSVDTEPTPSGAGKATLIEVSQERYVEDWEAIAPIVFGESEVVVASSLIEGVDVVVTLGTDYFATKRGAPPDDATEPNDTSPPSTGTVTSDE